MLPLQVSGVGDVESSVAGQLWALAQSKLYLSHPSESTPRAPNVSTATLMHTHPGLTKRMRVRNGKTAMYNILRFCHTHTCNFLLKGATELKFVPFCSSFRALSDGMLFARNRNFPFLAENHGGKVF